MAMVNQGGILKNKRNLKSIRKLVNLLTIVSMEEKTTCRLWTFYLALRSRFQMKFHRENPSTTFNAPSQRTAHHLLKVSWDTYDMKLFWKSGHQATLLSIRNDSKCPTSQKSTFEILRWWLVCFLLRIERKVVVFVVSLSLGYRNDVLVISFA